ARRRQLYRRLPAQENRRSGYAQADRRRDLPRRRVNHREATQHQKAQRVVPVAAPIRQNGATERMRAALRRAGETLPKMQRAAHRSGSRPDRSPVQTNRLYRTQVANCRHLKNKSAGPATGASPQHREMLTITEMIVTALTALPAVHSLHTADRDRLWKAL